ncbi:YciK family oxidoreductase [Alteromonas sp. 5E99-2]|uniref:YciK family oxidoreductase n=1 Tax=Alteromonas sp. 5E99-2 TaxID=2817683 RepID=UPI001A987C33|nr:YciK family oxidoreductase [Alteromonas sp. 5E99-2]MBO1255523.1 YciK family oxidoreductase [Alteromonas sp. 5E99-2]
MTSSVTSNDRLKNKIILITGAGGGIGKQAALTFSQYGATCILLGRTVNRLEQTYDEILAKGYNEPSILPLDMKGATPSHYKQMAQTITNEYGRLDGCLHNASQLGSLCQFKDIESQQWNDVLKVNVTATAQMTQALLSPLSLANSASIVFTSSSVGRKGRAFWGSYSVSKFATEGMMQVLADEYKSSSMRFNCINPGATRTEMRAKAYPAEDPLTLKTAEDIMPTYVYLMSDESKNENGQSFDCQPK